MATATTSATRSDPPVANLPVLSYLQWGPVFAGAVAAAAISFLLLTFGAGIGLSVASPWPNSGLSVTTISILAGVWTLLVQVGGFAAGGYLAGRMRTKLTDVHSSETEFRDGAHGLVVWAVGILLGALVAGMTTGAITKAAVDTTATVAGGAAMGAAAKGTETLATGPLDYGVDYLFRPSPGAPAAAPTGQAAAGGPTYADTKAEASRIFAAALKNGSLAPREREYLARVIASRTGMSQPDAERRVDEAMTEVKNVEMKAREAADKARKAAAIAAFLAAASLLVSCAAACTAAGLGGRHRDESRHAQLFGKRFW